MLGTITWAAETDVDALLNAVVSLAEAPAVNDRVGALAGERALVDRIAGLERVKAACAATQAVLTAQLFEMQRAGAQVGRANEQDGARPQVDEAELLRSVGAQVGFARRESPHAGRGHLGLARALTHLPAIRQCLQRGETSEYRVTLVARELGCLSAADRGKADEMVAAKLPRQGNEQARRYAAGVVHQFDTEAALAKIKAAQRGRCVSIRSLPDAMVRISATVPMLGGVAAFAGLHRHADTRAASPGHEDRSRGQIMADEFLARLLGTSTLADTTPDPETDEAGLTVADGDLREAEARDAFAADMAETDTDTAETVPAGSGDADECVSPDPRGTDAAADHAAHTAAGGEPSADPARSPFRPPGPPGGIDEYGVPLDRGTVDIQLIMTDRALFDGDDEPALVPGFGPIPAALARRIVAADRTTRVFLRRLFTRPSDHQIVAMDSRARLFPSGARRLLLARDQICRTPWCDAPIRQLDHIASHRRGGPTELVNAQGLCAACNLTKETAGWHHRTTSDGAIRITTPTGHPQESRPPDPPRSEPWAG